VYDVLVIGGGPAGLYAANQLARLGHAVALFEEHPEIGLPVHCTGLVAGEAFTRFSLPRDAILGQHQATRFYSSSGYELSYAPPDPETVVVDRPRFDQALCRQAEAAGVGVFRGARATQVRRHKGGLAVRLEGHDHAGQVVRGKLLVLATGASYHLHKQLDLPLPGRFVLTAQLEADFADSAEVELYFGNRVAPGSFAWVVPVKRDGQPRARLGLMTDADVEGYFLRFLQSPSVHTRLRDGLVTRFRRRPIPLAPLCRTFGERVLVVGDAAGLTKPTTGGGIYYSLLSAELAATVAHEALAENSYSAEFLSRYQQAWKARLGSELRWGLWFRRQAERFTDPQIDEAFRLAAREPVARLIQTHATFNWHGGLIQALVRHRQVRSFLFRVVVGRSLDFVRRKSEEMTVLPPTEESGHEAYQT